MTSCSFVFEADLDHKNDKLLKFLEQNLWASKLSRKNNTKNIRFSR